MNDNGDCTSIQCPRCRGAGRVELSLSNRKCLEAIRRLKNPTIAELHEASGKGYIHSATNKRVARLKMAGLVRLVKVKGLRDRVQLA